MKTANAITTRLYGNKATSTHRDGIAKVCRIAKKIQRESEAMCNGSYAEDSHTEELSMLRDLMRLGYTTTEAHDKLNARKNQIVTDAENAITRLTAKVHTLCKSLDLHYIVQTDPRGPSLYLSMQPFTEQDVHASHVHAVI